MASTRRDAQVKNWVKRTGQVRRAAVKPLPQDLSEFDKPAVINMFKMMAILDHGNSDGWEVFRNDFIKNQVNLPGKDKQESVNANLYSKLQNQNISSEDQVMNDMAIDTNEVINKIHEGTVDVGEGQEELDKMAMIEGDMPGQGKHKQGNWRG